MLSSSVFYPLQFALDNRSLFPSAVVKILKPFIAKPTMCRNNNIKSITHFAANVKCGNHSAAPHRVLRGTPGFRQNDPLSASIPLMTRCASITVGYPLQPVISFLSKQATTTAYKYKRIFLAKKGPSLLARTFRLWLRTEGRSAGTAACQPANENRVDLRRQAIGHYAVKDDGDTIPRPITTRMTSVHKNILVRLPGHVPADRTDAPPARLQSSA